MLDAYGMVWYLPAPRRCSNAHKGFETSCCVYQAGTQKAGREQGSCKRYPDDHERVHRHIDPQGSGKEGGVMLRVLDEGTYTRFWSKVDKTEGCWIWRAGTIGAGYGLFKFHGKNHYAHRISYETNAGIIPRGLEIDHLCRTKLCVNPAHLEAVPHRVNIHRIVRRNPCPHGNQVKRKCNLCMARAARLYRARKSLTGQNKTNLEVQS